MPVMDIRIVRVNMYQWNMFVWMNMWLNPVPFEIVGMLVMHIVAVRVAMRQWIMRMFMAVRLGHVQPDACSHQHGGNPEECSRNFAQHH